uniref:Uncharacterized protein n=1 Tax=Arundo donax TaxID=35708 RepID=A0A0A9ET21_ARUDO
MTTKMTIQTSPMSTEK